MVTMDAVQGADLMQLLIPRITIPVHFDDYPLFRSPLAEFRAEVTRRGLLDQVRFVERGDTVALNPIRSTVRDPGEAPDDRHR
jgi:L-ascorbate metabolism protein UlaG (beta-lactamase superfamily)